MKKLSLIVAATAFTCLAQAQPRASIGGYADAFIVPSAKLDVSVPGFGSADDDGDGFGLRVHAPFSEGLAFDGEYRTTSYDDSDLDFDQLRFGLAAGGATAVRVEYVNAELDGDDANGFGLHGVFRSDVSEQVELFGTVGYLFLEDDDDNDVEGLEFSAGLSIALSPALGLIASYRKTALEVDGGAGGDTDFDFDDISIGLRAYF